MKSTKGSPSRSKNTSPGAAACVGRVLSRTRPPSPSNRDRGWPRGLSLPHHRAYGSVHGGSVGKRSCWRRGKLGRARRGGRREAMLRAGLRRAAKLQRAASGSRRQIPADAAASQLGEPSSPAFPLLPGDGTQPSPGPLVEVAQHRRNFAEVEVAAPPSEVDRQLLDDPREALASRTKRQFPHSASEPGQRLRRDAPSRLCPTREAEAQELALTRSGDRTLRLVDPELEASGQNLSMLAITRSPAR